LTAGTQTEPLEFRLAPAATIRGRVVDKKGDAVSGAFVAVSRWRGHQSLSFSARTDAEGHFHWASAPHDAVQFAILKDGFGDLPDYTLVASPTEQ